jgi:hypothetical protein
VNHNRCGVALPWRREDGALTRDLALHPRRTASTRSAPRRASAFDQLRLAGPPVSKKPLKSNNICIWPWGLLRDPVLGGLRCGPQAGKQAAHFLDRQRQGTSLPLVTLGPGRRPVGGPP